MMTLLGVTYRRDVGGVRESPALEIVQLLRQRGARLNRDQREHRDKIVTL